jgi:AcrR family transcriptional regulator
MGTLERKEREKEQRRKAILKAARKVFFEHGLQAASMDMIAELAELSKGALYLYFKSKEDLYVSLLEEGLAILRRMFEEVAARPLPGDQALREIGLAYYEFFKRHPDYFQILKFTDTRGLHSKVSHEVLQCTEKRSMGCLQVVASVYERGVKEGIYRSDLTPMEVAVMLWGSSNGMIALIANQHDDLIHDQSLDYEKIMFASWDLMLNSLRATSQSSRRKN